MKKRFPSTSQHFQPPVQERMLMKKKILIHAALYAFVMFAMSLCSYMSISFLWGSKQLCLTGLSLFFPALGAFIALPQSAILIGLFYALKTLFGYYTFTFGIPTLAATTLWSITYCNTFFSKTFTNFFKFFLQICIPLICMALFITHPIGENAIPYALYWFIPMIIFIRQGKRGTSVFSTALSSTFIAHAVGSVIHLYTLSIPAGVWLSLIPMVAIERLIFASGTAIAFYAIQKIIHAVSEAKIVHSRKQPVTYLN